MYIDNCSFKKEVKNYLDFIYIKKFATQDHKRVERSCCVFFLSVESEPV